MDSGTNAEFIDGFDNKAKFNIPAGSRNVFVIGECESGIAANISGAKIGYGRILHAFAVFGNTGVAQICYSDSKAPVNQV